MNIWPGWSIHTTPFCCFCCCCCCYCCYLLLCVSEKRTHEINKYKSVNVWNGWQFNGIHSQNPIQSGYQFIIHIIHFENWNGTKKWLSSHSNIIHFIIKFNVYTQPYFPFSSFRPYRMEFIAVFRLFEQHQAQ